ncbi:D-alanyl-D-alanine carboxypeptidase/D-alanyl-D-alanine-endopeptidase [Terriglobus sp. RCC_193]|uniref:D-alanyl-D-alanine carboxypeptidase/D-alanyl-D-alanine endopeptidase n=1 Tax=Terriglobus sp. RCC_193 TaxID=3239218 RepID=UPI003524860F
MSFRFLPVLLLSVSIASASGQTQALPTYDGLPLSERVQRITSEPNVVRAHWGVRVTKLDGTPVFTMNDVQLFQPASNAKLFTTATAIALLGADTTFETRVIANPLKPIHDGNLEGDLELAGDGDPNLSGTTLPYLSPAQRPKVDPNAPPVDPLRYLAQLADKVAATGLKHVAGNIVGDDTLFPYEPYPEDWSIDDAVWGYGAPVSALTINDNLINIKLKPGAKVGDPITYELSPAMPWYSIDTVDAKTGDAKSGSHLVIDRMPDSRNIRIYGSIAVDSAPDNEELAMNDPADYAATAFKMLLEQRGIKVDGKPVSKHRLPQNEGSFTVEARKPVTLPEAGVLAHRPAVSSENVPSASTNGSDVVLASFASQTVATDMMLTNKISQNLHAEIFLHQLGAAFGNGSTLSGARVVRTFVTQRAGVDPEDFIFFDGSGLSGHDLVTPRAITTLLQYAATQPWFAAWKATLPVGGEDGTLRARFPGAPMKDHVFAKTGTLSEARALSGYIDCASGQTLIFSVMVNAHTPRTSDDMKAMDRIVSAIAATN